ncbi:hypothetical protein HK098_002058 [Nowakowskiella sp. JEL0407]|nr:hypothetical protein HK098_002058 [Nowakowskiella sp. JEL0407]
MSTYARADARNFSRNRKEIEEKAVENLKLSPELLTSKISPPTVNDDLVEIWRKLLLIETQDGISEFKEQYANGTVKSNFNMSRLECRSASEISKRYRDSAQWSCKLSIKKSKDGADDLIVEDLWRMLFRLPNMWMLVVNAKNSTSECSETRNFQCEVDLYTLDFKKIDPTSNLKKEAKCAKYESLVSLFHRLYALSKLKKSVHPRLYKFLKTGNLKHSGKGSFRPVPAEVKSTLNNTQLKVLEEIQDFDAVQGPPGTGKSTFIAEIIRLRIQENSTVLICTTTNKAIESLTEKLVQAGFQDEILAFGNKHRMGPSTSKFLFEENYKSDHQLSLAKNTAKPLTGFQNLLTIVKTECTRYSWTLVKKVFQVLINGLRELNFLTARPEVTNLINEISSILKEMDTFTTYTFTDKMHLKMPQVATNFETFLMRFSAMRKVELVQESRIIVCTASVAVSLDQKFRALQISNDTSNIAATYNDKDDQRYEFNSGHKFPTIKIDHVIIDEAGAMLVPDVFGCVIHGCESLTLVGDPRQLPPYTAWKHADEYKFNVSLMELVRATEPSRNMLNIQYRMHPKICETVSRVFYDGFLQTAGKTAASRKRKSAMFFKNVPTGERAIGTSYVNENEIEQVFRIVEIERKKTPHATVLIITFYQGQMQMIQNRLNQTKKTEKNEELGSIDVLTVDSAQGREADVVIVSTTRSKGHPGFTDNPKRINVACSRAKHVQ